MVSGLRADSVYRLAMATGRLLTAKTRTAGWDSHKRVGAGGRGCCLATLTAPAVNV